MMLIKRYISIGVWNKHMGSGRGREGKGYISIGVRNIPKTIDDAFSSRVALLRVICAQPWFMNATRRDLTVKNSIIILYINFYYLFTLHVVLCERIGILVFLVG